jgi:hypothetical protein
MTITKNLGLIENVENEFGNVCWTTLIVGGQSANFINTAPVHAFGVHALVEFEGKLHLMCEDDGHFWTHTILTEEDVDELKALVDQFISEFTFGKGFKITPKHRSRFQWNRRHPKFPTTFTAWKGSPAPSVTIMTNGEELTMNVSWLKTLSIVLDIH